MDRRSFVKACAAAGGAVALGAAGIGVAKGLARTRSGAATFRYVGAHKVGGPAPRGVPYVPLAVENGVVVGRTSLRVGRAEWDTLRWLGFCGHENAKGLQPAYAGDDVLRYHLPGELGERIRPWYADKLGEPVVPSDFPGPGFGARFVWRGDLTGVVLMLDGEGLREPTERIPPAKPLADGERKALGSLGAKGLVAASNVCTHFCCEAGWKEAEALARPRDAWDKLFCTCHNAVFDLRAPVAYEAAAPLAIAP